MQHPLLQLVASRSLNARIWEFHPPEDALVFTDDKAPVEQVIHNLILKYMLGG